MDTSKINKPDKNKPIGRMLELKQNASQERVAPTTVVMIVVVTALFAFMLGTRAEDYASIGRLLGGNSDDQALSEDLDYSSVEKLYDQLKDQYDGELTSAQVLDGIKKGLAESTGDPYTTYLNEEQAKQFNDELNGTFSGIGAEIGKEGEYVIIVSPLDGYPADIAGLKSGDKILEIDGEDAIGISIEEAILRIRGEAGTDVVLTIFRGSEQFDINVTRQNIVVPSVTHEINDDGIGIITLSRFAEDTSRLVNIAAEDFLDSNVKGVIVDLRGNSGGFLTSAIDVASLWLDNKLVTQQREDSGAKVVDSLKSTRGAKLGDISTVVLIDKGSASASEIVVGALKDYGAATIIGETSYGKGSVQNLETLSDGGVLKVTVARWYTPNGVNIDHEGIAPDVEVVYIPNDDGVDNQLQAALDFLLK